ARGSGDDRRDHCSHDLHGLATDVDHASHRAVADRRYDVVSQRRAPRLRSGAQEHFSGAQTVQIFNAEAKSLRRFAKINDEHRNANIDTIYYYAVFFPLVDFIGAIGIALVIWFGGYRVMQHALT